MSWECPNCRSKDYSFQEGITLNDVYNELKEIRRLILPLVKCIQPLATKLSSQLESIPQLNVKTPQHQPSSQRLRAAFESKVQNTASQSFVRKRLYSEDAPKNMYTHGKMDRRGTSMSIKERQGGELSLADRKRLLDESLEQKIRKDAAKKIKLNPFQMIKL